MKKLKVGITMAAMFVMALVLSAAKPSYASEPFEARSTLATASSCAVIFWSDIDQRGEAFQACSTARFATMPGSWNDRISSLATGSGRVLIYEHTGFTGKCRGIGSGEYWGNLTQIPMRNGLSWNDQVSSFIVNPSNWEWLNCR